MSRYLFDVGKHDFARMSVLSDIYISYSEAFLISLGLTEGMDVADIGCGPGNVSLWLSEQVGVSGSVTAVDNSQKQIDIVKQRSMDHGLTNIITDVVDIYNINKLERKFDFVFCRFLFVHLDNPELALQKLKLLLKPNGYLVIAELDNSGWTCYPVNPYFEAEKSRMFELAKRNNTDFFFG